VRTGSRSSTRFTASATPGRKATDTVARAGATSSSEKKPADELNVDAVFAKLKQLGGSKSENE